MMPKAWSEVVVVESIVSGRRSTRTSRVDQIRLRDLFGIWAGPVQYLLTVNSEDLSRGKVQYISEL